MRDSLDRLRRVAASGFKAAADAVVEEAVALTGSTMAYFAVIDGAGQTLTMVAWSRSAMAQCLMDDKPLVYPVEATGLWGDCVRERRAVITNDYPACTRPTRKGYPDGHVPVTRHLNVPVMDGPAIRGILGVGNKPDPYTEADAQALQAFANAAWPIVRQARGDEAP